MSADRSRRPGGSLSHPGAAFTAIVVIGAVAFTATPAAAAAQSSEEEIELQVRANDIVELANGQKLEGEVVSEKTDEIVFRQIGGIQSTLPRANIRRILPRNPPEKVYSVRVAKHFDATRLDDQLALSRWCLEPGIGLGAQGILHLEEAALLAPERGETYAALLPLYRGRTPGGSSTEIHDRELATCLLGIEAGVAMADLSMHAARLLVALGDPRGAILLLEPLADDPPGDPVVSGAQDLLAGLLVGAGRREEARELIERWLSERSGAAALALWRLRTEWLLEDVAAGVEGAETELEETLRQVIALSPTDGRAYLHRGAFGLLRGDVAAARADFFKAHELGEVGGEAAVTFAICLARGGETDRALELISSTRNSEGVADLMRVVEAYVHENIGERDHAAELLAEAVGFDTAPWQAVVIALQGRARLVPGFPLTREAAAALERFGDNPAAFAELSVLLGDAAWATGRPAEARRWLGYAVAAGRKIPEVLLRLGLAHLADGGDPRRARECLEQGVAERPEDADLRNALGCLEYRAGDLPRAREQFELALRAAGTPADGEAPSPARAYALAALELVDRTLGEEVWTDEFARPDGPQILNNWEKRETFGIAIELRDECVLFSGTQKFQPEGLTKLHRPVDPTTIARVRARIRIPDSSVPARIGLRLARVEGSEEGDGIVVYRDLDGVIAIALLAGGEAEVIRSDADPSAHEGIALVATSWPADGGAHLLELRLPPPEGDEGAAVYLDGVPVIRGIELSRFKGRGITAVAGVSGQADLDRSYRFEVLDFELYRRRPRAESGSTPR